MSMFKLIGSIASAVLLIFASSHLLGFIPISKGHASLLVSGAFMAVFALSLLTCISIFIDGRWKESVIGYVIVWLVCVAALFIRFGVSARERDLSLVLYGMFLFMGLPLGNLIMLNWYAIRGWPQSETRT
jgi:hypothetical protein